MDRTVLRQKERFQLSYELPHEAYFSHVYPRQSSNGSTVIIYGHEEGLRLAWYAGKPFKPTKKDAAPPKVNGTARKDAMVIDLDDDDDEPGPKEAPTAPAEFEEEDEEIEPTAPYRDILRYVDIPLGTAAMRIAVPHIPKDPTQISSESWPAIYKERILVAVACSDASIRVISAPLDPPAIGVEDVSKMDVQVLKIFGPTSHQEFISDIAVTHTTGISHDQDDVERQPRNTTQDGTQPKSTSSSETPQWSLLIATVSCSGGGLLLVHQVPIQSSKMLSTAPEHFLPIRRHHLRASTMSAKLAFNPSPYPAERHSSLLITLPAASCIKLFQVFPTSPRERRGSTATTDSASTMRSVRTAGGSRGKFLMTFLPTFTQEADAAGPRRKSVLDAQWVAGGRAVIALLEDGEWGIYDLEAVGPMSSNTGGNLIRGQGNISGIHGGSLTKFAIRSTISPAEETKQKTSNAESQPATGTLAPMTPSTRKARSEGLFHGSKRNKSTSESQSRRGSIYVDGNHSNRTHDESAVISYAGQDIYISSISSFWKSELKPTRLPTMKTGGQQTRSLSLLPRSSGNGGGSAGLFGLATSTPDFLIQTDHRLIFSVNPLSETTSTSTQTALSLAPEAFDQALLASGELDVDGMDRVLEQMGGSGGLAASVSKPMNIFTKSVGFQIDDDEDEDVEMASPTPAKFSSFKPRNWSRPSTGAPKTQRRIFT
ncbi:hypothetical protein EDD37DRAFT_130160 [Exophiala viscosa]|uniref:Uncharacterized protein n=1 Tax=Exophiala viscosa TaxID=2486360 RepID=A0AAN6DP24_9EURO|nr:hypothetical protein EDD36DRAFT_79029 [Exophiala viscosa]KAI1620752.1 hypothetical protein EDD37DRAFT_130160 [Exophiala viscosa]